MTATDATPPTFDAVLPVVQKYAPKCLSGCPDRECLAVTLAWFYWSRSDKKSLPPSVWAKIAVKQVRSGRDIPGVQSKFRDAMKRLETQGAGMQGVADRRPDPVQVAIARESERFFDALDDFSREMCDMLSEGVPNQVVAKRLGRTGAAISQRRRKLMERHRAE